MGNGSDIDDLLGRTWADRYEILEYLGRGGMGAVFKARQIHMDRLVALKVIHRRLCKDERQVQRFEQEARTSSKLHHPNSIRVFDYGKSDDGRLFMAMELLKGKTLGRLIAQEGALDLPRVVHIARQLFKSLAEAHQLGLVHRDLKPENIFICEIFGEHDFVKVLDFGIAKAIGPSAAQPNLTQTGFICGTPRYLSPEQALGQRVDGRADLYAVGVLIYEMLTGSPPFVGENPITIVMKHVHDDPPPMVGVDVKAAGAARLVWLVDRLLEKNPNKRPNPAQRIVDFIDEKATKSDLLGAAPRDTTGQREAMTVVGREQINDEDEALPDDPTPVVIPIDQSDPGVPHVTTDPGDVAEVTTSPDFDPPESGEASSTHMTPPPLPPEAGGTPVGNRSIPVNPGAETTMIPSVEGLLAATREAEERDRNDTALIESPISLDQNFTPQPDATVVLTDKTSGDTPHETPEDGSFPTSPVKTPHRESLWAWALIGALGALLFLACFSYWWTSRVESTQPDRIATTESANSETSSPSQGGGISADKASEPEIKQGKKSPSNLLAVKDKAEGVESQGKHPEPGAVVGGFLGQLDVAAIHDAYMAKLPSGAEEETESVKKSEKPTGKGQSAKGDAKTKKSPKRDRKKRPKKVRKKSKEPVFETF